MKQLEALLFVFLYLLFFIAPLLEGLGDGSHVPFWGLNEIRVPILWCHHPDFVRLGSQGHGHWDGSHVPLKGFGPRGTGTLSQLVRDTGRTWGRFRVPAIRKGFEGNVIPVSPFIPVKVGRSGQ